MSARRKTLGMQVAAAVGGMLTGRDSITLGEVEEALPAHILAGRPSHKSIVSAIVAAGWIGERQAGGRIVYLPPRGEDEAAGEGDNRPVVDEELMRFVERVMRLRQERRELLKDEQDIVREAKSRGYDAVQLRRAITIAGKEREDWHAGEAVLETYLRGLGLVQE